MLLADDGRPTGVTWNYTRKEILADGAVHVVGVALGVAGAIAIVVIAALSPLYPHVAVLFVTGFAGEVNVAQFGGHEVLRKPFTLNGLERAVLTAMAAERRETNHPIAAE